MRTPTEHCPDNIPSGKASALPEFIRLPRSGAKDPITSLNRSALNALILPTRENGYKPPVLSVVLKSRKGATRGVRLINVRSLLDYLQGLLPEESQAQQ